MEKYELNNDAKIHSHKGEKYNVCEGERKEIYIC